MTLVKLQITELLFRRLIMQEIGYSCLQMYYLTFN